MKKLGVFVFILLISISFATETISDLNSNSPVPLGQNLVVTGNYNNTDSNSSIFCSFFVKDNNITVERLTDERIFTNGDIYAEREITEPIYKRGSFYVVTISCGNASGDTNFTVAQRETIDRVANQEFRYVFSEGNVDAAMVFGIIILGISSLAFVTFFVIKGAWR